MSGFKNKFKTIADPANIFGKRAGGFDIADAMDPGGKIVKEITGSDIARKIADPGKLYSTGEVYEVPETVLTYEEKREKRLESEAKAADLQRRRRIASKRILSTEID